MKLISLNITPGPWMLEAGRTIVTPSGTFILTYGHEKGTNAPRFTSPTQLDRNAQAIAALPQCLAALERLLELSDKQLDQSATHDGLENCKALASARAALLAAGYKEETL